MKKKNLYWIAGGLAVLGGILYYKKSQGEKKPFLGWLFGTKRTPSTSTNQNILFVGDSITADPNWSYPALIRKSRPDLNIDLNAKSGQTTSWMLLNLPAKLKAKKYGKVFIYGGVNDAYSATMKLDTAVSNVQKMVDLARQNGAQVYVILGYEPTGFMDYRKMPVTRYIKSKQAYIPLIERYKTLQNMYASRIKNATLIPKFNLGTMTSDGTHPNGAGQSKIAEVIKRYL